MSLRNGALLKQLPMLGHIPPKSECVEPGGSNQGLTPLQTKNPRQGEGFMFGRTRRIRTADLYHVKVAL